MKKQLNPSDHAMLQLFTVIESERTVTQRELGKRLGVGLGTMNNLLKRAVRKGYVKVSQAPAKRFAYYVTPKGFLEKSRLVAEFLSSSLDFYRRARREFTSIFDKASRRGYKRLALYGTGELAEIAISSIGDNTVSVVAIISLHSNESRFLGRPVVTKLDSIDSYGLDAVILTCAENAQDSYNLLLDYFPDNQIYTADSLHVSRAPVIGDDS